MSKHTNVGERLAHRVTKHLKPHETLKHWTWKFKRGQTIARNRENSDERIKPLKLGLLGSSGTHRGTRWPTKNFMAAREGSRGNLNPEIHRGTLRGSWTLSAVRDEASTPNLYKTKTIMPSLPILIILLDSTLNLSAYLRHYHLDWALEVIGGHIWAWGTWRTQGRRPSKFEDHHLLLVLDQTHEPGIPGAEEASSQGFKKL